MNPVGRRGSGDPQLAILIQNLQGVTVDDELHFGLTIIDDRCIGPGGCVMTDRDDTPPRGRRSRVLMKALIPFSLPALISIN